jgi:3-methyl-2-oxobutanoate hydroxymethyltransferase
MDEKITVPAIRACKNSRKIAMITAYDAPSALIADRAGMDIILVGDSLATTVLGFDDTLPATIDIMLHHTCAVTRTKPKALVVADMPWLSYHISIEETIRNAGRLIREGGANAVKLEGGRKRLPVIEALLAAEIPVMGHLGLTPQSVLVMGGYRVQGKQLSAAQELLADARALADAGIFALVLEGIPAALAQIITREVAVPTIGIGAGPYCNGQVLVFHDTLGFQFGHYPKFVRQYANLGEQAIQALQQYRSDVLEGTFPNEKESYRSGEDIEQLLHGQEQNTTE